DTVLSSNNMACHRPGTIHNKTKIDFHKVLRTCHRAGTIQVARNLSEVDQGGGTVNEDGISLYSSQTRVELSNEDFNDPKREIKDGLKEEKNKNEILNKLKTLE
ncbi:11357_t:CDS:2, partial [Funneliformis geosporum]